MAAKRYVLAGAGGRGISMFARPLLAGDFADSAELVGLFDHNPSRLRAALELLEADLPIYTDYQQMLRDADPDAVIVATRDDTHCRFIVQALQAGKRAISEKPLCTTAEQCRQIAEAARCSGQVGLVTHNERYGTASGQIKQLLKAGRIGKVLTVEYHEMLDRRHGADYFRRWHRRKACSGGLLIHKASHHFDLLNWFAQARPRTLVAVGGLSFYGRNGPFRHQRCRGCPHASKCPFYVDLFANERARKLYLQAEADDGYIRDGCVFDEQIDIEDHATVTYDYDNGIRATYTMLAFASYEGHRIIIEGTRGRIELHTVKDTSWAAGGMVVPGLEQYVGEELRIFEPGGGVETIPVVRPEGGHGGADPQLRHEFFGRDWDAPPTERMASLDQAIQAVLIGAAANRSIATGQPVAVQDLLHQA